MTTIVTEKTHFVKRPCCCGNTWEPLGIVRNSEQLARHIVQNIEASALLFPTPVALFVPVLDMSGNEWLGFDDYVEQSRIFFRSWLGGGDSTEVIDDYHLSLPPELAQDDNDFTVIIAEVKPVALLTYSDWLAARLIDLIKQTGDDAIVLDYGLGFIDFRQPHIQ